VTECKFKIIWIACLNSFLIFISIVLNDLAPHNSMFLSFINEEFDHIHRTSLL
jgi:hypothetical protein